VRRRQGSLLPVAAPPVSPQAVMPYSSPARYG
jgi:hypothetical protein